MPTDYKIESGLDIARYFTYFRYHKQSRNVNIVNVSGKRIYNIYRKYFDGLFKLYKKYDLNIVGYVKYFVFNLEKTEKEVPDLLNINFIRKYAEQLATIEQYNKIYGYFMKSAEYIADVCAAKKYPSCKEYLKRLVLHNQLAEKYISGKISIYYLASINNIVDLINHMDQMNRDTFANLLTRRDKLNSDIQEAFMYIKSQKINPIKFTDNLLFRKLGYIDENK